MRFNTTQIQLSTQVNKDSGAIVTNLTLTGCEVPDEVVANSLLSGQSPRVRLQNNWRSNGIPRVLSMSWADYLSGKAPRIIIPETPEQIVAKAKTDPKYLAEILAGLGLELPNETEETGEKDPE